MPLIAHDVHSTSSMYTRQTRGSLVINVYIVYSYIFHFIKNIGIYLNNYETIIYIIIYFLDFKIL